MAKNYYLPKDDSGKAELLEHLANRLPAYAETLEVSAADIASLQADAEAFRDAMKRYSDATGTYEAFADELVRNF